jgi:hypothetical protein
LYLLLKDTRYVVSASRGLPVLAGNEGAMRAVESVCRPINPDDFIRRGVNLNDVATGIAGHIQESLIGCHAHAVADAVVSGKFLARLEPLEEAGL